MVGVHDSCYDVTTKGRTNLIEQVLVDLALFLVLIRTNLQFGAVSRQTRGQRRRHTGTEVAADDGSTHQADLRLFLLEEVHQNIRVGSRGVGEQLGSVEDKELVNTVRQNLVLHLAFDACTNHHSVEFHFQFIGEFATFGQQLLRYFLYGRTFNLAIYKYVIHISINQ